LIPRQLHTGGNIFELLNSNHYENIVIKIRHQRL